MKLFPLPCDYKADLAFAGHIGVGHVNSHQGFVQDDAAGFAALLALLLRICPLDMTVTAICTDGDRLTVSLACGGQGQASLPGGFSPFEADLLQRGTGLCELSSQTLATRVLGRIRGQGMDKRGAVLILAHVRALLDAIRRHWPAGVRHITDDIPGSCGEFLGGMLSLEGTACAWMLTINASPDGSGPVEDSEGILPVGSKGRLMQELGMCRTPCIVLESKAYSPGDSDGLAASRPWIRWNQDSDNPTVGWCLVQAARQCHARAVVNDRAYPRRPGELDRASQALGGKISKLGQDYARARTSAQKVALAAALADILEQEIGGTSFMSQAVHATAAGGGLWPGQAAMLSLLASREEYRSLKVLITTRQELELLADIALTAAVLLRERLSEAAAFIRARTPQPEPERLLSELCLPA